MLTSWNATTTYLIPLRADVNGGHLAILVERVARLYVVLRELEPVGLVAAVIECDNREGNVILRRR